LPADRVLVDTSVWIEHFTLARHPSSAKLTALHEGGVLVTTGLVLAELLQGSQSAVDRAIHDGILATVPVAAETTESWLQAGRLWALLRRKGRPIPLMDCLLAAIAVEHRAALLSYDGHFREIAKHFPLEIEPSD